MQSTYEPFQQYLQILCCPRCKSSLELNNDTLVCQNNHCNRAYPIVDGRPILINEDNSLFAIADYLNVPKKSPAYKENNIISHLKKFRRSHFSLSTDIRGKGRFRKFRELVEENNSSVVLVVGAGTEGAGMQEITNSLSITRIDTDVKMTPNTSIICDAHDLPFTEGSIDGVIVQAVLEHVVDPYRCVAEVYRSLKNTGLVYSEIPFMQQVHLGKFDFTRFTHLGHRRLFRHFEEIDSGLVAGPGTSLAWNFSYLLLSFATSRVLRKFLAGIVPMFFFWVKYLDYPLKNSPGALDAASATYFLGKKSKEIISDKDIIAQYKGAQ